MVGFSGIWNGRGRKAKAAARALYARVAEAALDTGLYAQGAAIDTFEGRAAMVTAHAALVIGRLRRIGSAQARKTAESLNHLVLDGFDAAFRELGVGDSSIARKVRKLAEVHYGIGKSLSVALDQPAPGRTGALIDTIQRNGLTQPGQEGRLAEYLLQNQAALDATTDDSILAGNFDWSTLRQD